MWIGSDCVQSHSRSHYSDSNLKEKLKGSKGSKGLYVIFKFERFESFMKKFLTYN